MISDLFQTDPTFGSTRRDIDPVSEIFGTQGPVPMAQEQEREPDQSDDDSDELVLSQRALASGNSILEEYRRLRNQQGLDVPDELADIPRDPLLEELRQKYLFEAMQTPQERYRQKLEQFSQQHRGLKGGLKAFGKELLEFLSTAPFGAYAPPQVRMRLESEKEFKDIVPLAQNMATNTFSSARAVLSAQLRAQQLRQNAVLAQQRNDIAAAQAYSKLAHEQTRVAQAAQRAEEITAKLGLTRAQTEKIKQQIAQSSSTYGLGGMPGFVLALSQMPDDQRERVIRTYKEAAEAGRDPLRYAKFSLSAQREQEPKGPFVPMRNARGDIVAFYSPRDSRIVETPVAITDRPDSDQKAIDRANLVTVISNMAKLHKLHSEYMAQKGSPGGPIKGSLAILASKYNLPSPEAWKDDATAVAQMNALARHATRTLIYLMSGKAVSEREAADFDEVMPQLTVGSRDFEAKLATMLATIANFAEVRFGKSLDKIISDEAKISPQLLPDLSLAAHEVSWARSSSRTLYNEWKKFAPGFAERYKDVLLNPASVNVMSPEELIKPKSGEPGAVKERIKEISRKINSLFKKQ